MFDSVSVYAKDLPGVRAVHQMDLLTGNTRAKLNLFALRRQKYDLAILPFPAARWQYHAVLAAVGARKSATHDYGMSSSLIDRMIGALRVPLRGGHRVWENVRLANALGIEGESVEYLMPARWRSGLTESRLLGINTGSMRYKGNELKRWPIEFFVAVMRDQLAKGRAIRIFNGPQESDDRWAIEQAFASCSNRPEFVEGPLPYVAREMSKCEVFLGNDAGMSHVAAGLGVRTVVLFGMTDPQRALPIGPAVAVRPSACPPCHDEGSRKFECVRNIDSQCIRKDLKTEDVIVELDAMFLHRPLRLETMVESGPLRLYGRMRP